MQTQTLKNAKAAVFLYRSAVCLLILPVACLVWALQTYPPLDACWLCLSLAIYGWPFAGVLFIIAVGLRGNTPDHHLEQDTGFREAHGH
ncbi:hypothetical protein [Paraburkholderia sp. J67]|uniref:hypothetical protein n=1 Tax=Paraburkholderia sp. J67 TaxID=2805435 RepID=UPI002ABD2A14|nr:hypothetical protein [Paraburkholderia sp. J67]